MASQTNNLSCVVVIWSVHVTCVCVQELASVLTQHKQLQSAYDELQVNYMRAIRLVCDVKVDLACAQQSLQDKIIQLDEYRDTEDNNKVIVTDEF